MLYIYIYIYIYKFIYICITPRIITSRSAFEASCTMVRAWERDVIRHFESKYHE